MAYPAHLPDTRISYEFPWWIPLHVIFALSATQGSVRVAWWVGAATLCVELAREEKQSRRMDRQRGQGEAHYVEWSS